MPDSTFERLGPYRIQRVVGRGGMGSVFAARNQETGELAAIKVLAPALAADANFRDRFIDEIESLKKLHHPNIVQLFGFGEHDGHLYYAMELIDGTSLEQELAAGRRFNWREVTQIGIDVVRALKHAHDHGVIHRDLKPGNLLVDRQDRIKLTDFGIAKLFGATRVTSDGNVLGTADYMAPEQAAGEATTPRCDLYSLGCVMYALLAGRPPFVGNSIAEVVHNLRYEEPPPVTKWAHDVPRELEQVLRDLLVKDPDKRIRTALSLSHRLRAIQQALTISMNQTKPTGDNRTAAGANSGAAFEGSRTAPPPDIAVRPTVCLPASPPNTRLPNGAQSPQPPSEQATEGGEKRDHFTRVERAWKSETKSDILAALPVILLLLLAIGTLGYGVWYFTRPPSADALWQTIMSVDEAEPSNLLEVEGEVIQFKREFGHDARIAQVEEIAQDIKLYRLQRRLQLRARGRRTLGMLSPIEQTYLEAIRLSEKDLAAAVSVLEGMIALYGDQQDDPTKTGQMVALAFDQLPRWRTQLDETTSSHVEVLRERLKQAEEFRPHEPEKAQSIWRGIVELYGTRRQPQIAELVEQARREVQFAESLADVDEACEPPPGTVGNDQ